MAVPESPDIIRIPEGPGRSLCTLVVPCYNEAKRLDVDRYLAYLASHRAVRVVFVDDGSTDTTLEILRQMEDAAPQSVRVVALEKNRGKAEAVRRGMLDVLEDEGASQFVGYWDADLATPLEAIEEFLEVFTAHPSAMIVLGARVKLMGRAIRRNPARHYLGRIFATLASFLLGLGIYDTQCGAKLFRATPLARALFARPFLSRWIFDVEILARLVSRRNPATRRIVERAIYEYPLQRWMDVRGSKVSLLDALRAGADLLRIAWCYYGPRRETVAVQWPDAESPSEAVIAMPPAEPTRRDAA